MARIYYCFSYIARTIGATGQYKNSQRLLRHQLLYHTPYKIFILQSNKCHVNFGVNQVKHICECRFWVCQKIRIVSNLSCNRSGLTCAWELFILWDISNTLLMLHAIVNWESRQVICLVCFMNRITGKWSYTALSLLMKNGLIKLSTTMWILFTSQRSVLLTNIETVFV